MKTALLKIVGEKNLIFSPAPDDPRLTDHRGYFQGAPTAIAFPETTEQVARLVKYARQQQLGIVPQGGNTGYAGGATPDEHHQILICMNRMNKVIDVDQINYTMTVEAGCLLADIQQAASQANMLFPLNMGSAGSCQIGGNISTNAGGVSVLKYGNTRDLILGLEAVLPDGQILTDLNKLRKNNTGYNLAQLFAGAEGSLGIITGAVLKTVPQPDQQCCLMLAFDDLPQLFEFYQYARQQSADCLTSFEYISAAAARLVTEGPVAVSPPIASHYNHLAVVEFSSSSTLIALQTVIEELIESAFEKNMIADGLLAQSQRQRQAMWRFREAIPETERLIGGSIKHDIALPISKISEFLERIESQLDAVTPEYRLSVYGHIGDGNLHFNLLQVKNKNFVEFKQQHETLLSTTLYDLVAELGGSFSAEHGIGQLKREQLHRYKDKTSINLMRRIKTAVDPDNRMNPGKLIPICQ